MAIVAAIAAITTAGCSTDLPPAEVTGSPTARLGSTVVTLDPRQRVLSAGDERIPVGVGPTDVAAGGKNLAYVTDRPGDAVLVVRLRPQLEITRRVHVPGGPYAVKVDRGRLLVSTAEGTVTLTADGRPRPVAP